MSGRQTTGVPHHVADDDIGRIPYHCLGPPDVGEHDLGDKDRSRHDTKHLAHFNRHRGQQEHRSKLRYPKSRQASPLYHPKRCRRGKYIHFVVIIWIFGVVRLSFRAGIVHGLNSSPLKESCERYIHVSYLHSPPVSEDSAHRCCGCVAPCWPR